MYVCNNGGFEWHVVAGMTAPGHQPADYTGGRIQRVTLDGKVTEVGPGAMMYCAGNTLHGITNTGTTQMTFYWSKWLANGVNA